MPTLKSRITKLEQAASDVGGADLEQQLTVARKICERLPGLSEPDLEAIAFDVNEDPLARHAALRRLLKASDPVIVERARNVLNEETEEGIRQLQESINGMPVRSVQRRKVERMIAAKRRVMEPRI